MVNLTTAAATAKAATAANEIASQFTTGFFDDTMVANVTAIIEKHTTAGNCKDCKFWESHRDMRGKSWTTCEVAAWVSRSDVIADNAIAIYADASDDTGLDAGIKTGPMFGCIKFMAKKVKK